MDNYTEIDLSVVWLPQKKTPLFLYNIYCIYYGNSFPGLDCYLMVRGQSHSNFPSTSHFNFNPIIVFFFLSSPIPVLQKRMHRHDRIPVVKHHPRTGCVRNELHKAPTGYRRLHSPYLVHALRFSAQRYVVSQGIYCIPRTCPDCMRNRTAG